MLVSAICCPLTTLRNADHTMLSETCLGDLALCKADQLNCTHTAFPAHLTSRAALTAAAIHVLKCCIWGLHTCPAQVCCSGHVCGCTTPAAAARGLQSWAIAAQGTPLISHALELPPVLLTNALCSLHDQSNIYLVADMGKFRRYIRPRPAAVELSRDKKAETAAAPLAHYLCSWSGTLPSLCSSRPLVLPQWEFVRDVNAVVKKDDKVKVKVMSYDVGSRKLSLTMKIGEPPAREARQEGGGTGAASNGSAPGGASMQRPRQATQGEARCLRKPCLVGFPGSRLPASSLSCFWRG